MIESDSETENSAQKEREKKKLLALAPIAEPLAGKKLCNRTHKLVHRAAEDKCLKRGDKEVVESIRQGNEGMSGRKDPAWQYGELPDPKNTNNIKCKFCPMVAKGGITRLKQHFVGGFRNINRCDKCPEHVREEIKALMEKKKAVKEQMIAMPHFNDVVDERGKQVSSSHSSSQSSFQVPKPSRQIGPLDIYYGEDVEEICTERKRNSKGAPSYNNSRKEMRDYALQLFARWVYDTAIPFNVVNYDSFAPWVQAFGQFGPDMKPPTYHELRVVCLKKEKEHTQSLLKSHEEEQAKYGCSIMVDGWSDKKKGRSLINFLVNTTKGSRFIESIDGSNVSHSGEYIYSLLDRIVQKVGEKDVVQIVTDSTSSNVLAGRLLEAKYPHLYWTPCAARCLDLMLEDIFKIPLLKKTIERAIQVSGYIYGRLQLLSMMREFTNDKEMVVVAKTRFATAFLTLKRFHEEKANLKKLFTSEKWIESNYAKEEKGKATAKVILMPSFWNNILYAIKVAGPLVEVLRLVHGEKKPPMGYIYEAMERAKSAIKDSFGANEEKYVEIFKIIDKRWEIQLHHPLHAAGYILNPEFFYANTNEEKNGKLMIGFYDCVQRLSPDIETEDKIVDELLVYMKAESLFGIPAAIRQRVTKAPVDWWYSFGSSSPNLQKFAIKILSLTCSSSGCERNWSIFDLVHAKKRNKLFHKNMNDLIFIKFNRSLLRRYDMRDQIDPITLDIIDDSNEWLVGEMEDDEDNFVHNASDGLTCNMTADAAEVNENAYSLRSRGSKAPKDTTKKDCSASPAKLSSSKKKKKAKKTSTSSIRFALQSVDEDEEDGDGYEGEDDDVIGESRANNDDDDDDDKARVRGRGWRR